MLVAEEEHDGARVVQLIHVVEVRHLSRDETCTSEGSHGNSNSRQESGVQGEPSSKGFWCGLTVALRARLHTYNSHFTLSPSWIPKTQHHAVTLMACSHSTMPRPYTHFVGCCCSVLRRQGPISGPERRANVHCLKPSKTATS